MRIEEIGAATLVNGDCREVMRSMDENSVDAIVCDPPYGLRFMGKKWDYDVPGVDIWVECLRVLKPGGHLLAFAGTRTQHRMAVRIEDAGFEIRDMIAWVYGSGFPKHQSALKPALEPITMARKPAKRATLLNIDACRVETDELAGKIYNNSGANLSWGGTYGKGVVMGNSIGRYPANLIHDGSPEVLAMFPDSAGSGGSVPNVKISGYGDGAVGTGKSEYFGGERTPFDSGKGSAARFFYCAKASKKDRDEGLAEFPLSSRPTMGSGIGGQPDQSKANNRNPHPTVKPTELMRYLRRLVTPPGGTVLDPFMGSGSTGKAALREGFGFVGIDNDEEHGYFDIACARVKAATLPE